jgi:RNA polymerase sigma-70 factor (ECF subfamily)
MATPPTHEFLLDQARNISDAASWRRLTELYCPLIRRWIRASIEQPADAEDLIQEVLLTLVKELPRFHYNQRPGAFRAWLRAITVNRLREYWRSQRDQPRASGDEAAREALHQLDDPTSLLSRRWDRDHDLHVAVTILESIRPEFAPATWNAFESLVRDGRPAAEVAAELGLSVNAVLIAKSRVLKRLRQKTQALTE